MKESGVAVYLRVRPHWISVRVLPRQGETVHFEGVPRSAERRNRMPWGRQEVLALGDEVDHLREREEGEREVGVYDAFCHPRVLIDSVFGAQVVVGGFLERACGGRLPRGFRMIIHPADEMEGGLTRVEWDAFEELGRRLGAKHVTFHLGVYELDDETIRLLTRPQATRH